MAKSMFPDEISSLVEKENSRTTKEWLWAGIDSAKTEIILTRQNERQGRIFQLIREHNAQQESLNA